jgi:hypothetical protein
MHAGTRPASVPDPSAFGCPGSGFVPVYSNPDLEPDTFISKQTKIKNEENFDFYTHQIFTAGILKVT